MPPKSTFLDALLAVPIPPQIMVDGLTAHTSLPRGMTREKFFVKMRGRSADISGLVDDMLEVSTERDIGVELPYLDAINLDYGDTLGTRAVQLFCLDARGPCGYVRVSVDGSEGKGAHAVRSKQALASSIALDTVYLSKDLRGSGYGSAISNAAVSMAIDVWAEALQTLRTPHSEVALCFKAETESISGWLTAYSVARGISHSGIHGTAVSEAMEDVRTGSVVLRGHPVEFSLEIG